MQLRYLVYAFLWTCTAILSARVDLAALQLFIVFSIFLLILTNLGERDKGPSAYSVFNHDCSPILGQLSAEQFDAEIRHRPFDAPQQQQQQQQPQQHVQQASSHNTSSTESMLEAVRREIQHDQRRLRRNPPAQPPRRRR